MHKIGLIGGMSWESTSYYYSILNTYMKENLGGLHSSSCIINSVDFAEIETLQKSNQWQKCGQILANSAKELEAGGAKCIAICSNTMHKVSCDVQAAITIPLIHIADETGKVLIQNNITKVGLIGTRYTMDQDFYKERLVAMGIEVVVPNKDDQTIIHDIIFNELCLGIIHSKSKLSYLTIMSKLSKEGVNGIILGCTEIGLLVNQTDTTIPLFDTTLIHAQSLAKFSIK